MRDERDSGVMCESRSIAMVMEGVLWFEIEVKSAGVNRSKLNGRGDIGTVLVRRVGIGMRLRTSFASVSHWSRASKGGIVTRTSILRLIPS